MTGRARPPRSGSGGVVARLRALAGRARSASGAVPGLRAGSATEPADALGMAGASDDWSPTHRHRKGGLYRVLARGILEADRTPCVIYDDAEGTIWVRATAEFNDGRFQPLESD